MASIIVFKLTIFNVLNRQIHFKKVVNCVNYKMRLKQSNFERNAKKILVFEQLSSQRLEKHCLLIMQGIILYPN